MKTSAGVLRAAAYCRVSTDREDQANSLTGQRNYFTDYINSHTDWLLIEVYYDEGISGTQTWRRTGFNTMIDTALRGDIDLILTKEVSRFARNTVDTLSYTRKLKEAGVGVIFTLDNIDTRDTDGELRLSIMASIAQEESRKTSERVKWGQKRRMEQGIVFGRNLFGYTVTHGTLHINSEEAPVIRAIFHKYTNEGKGTYRIAKELQEAGIRPKRGDTWSTATILKILKNEKYVGDLCQKKTITPDYLTHTRICNRGEEEMVCLTDHHEPIIDRTLWNQTQIELEKRSVPEETRTRHSNRYWCSGKLYCAECGNRYVSRTKTLSDGSQYKSWRCSEAARHGAFKQNDEENTCGCSNASLNENALLGCMQFVLSHLLTDSPSLEKEIIKELRALRPDPDMTLPVSTIQKKLNLLHEKRKRTIDLMLEGLITREELEELTARYTEEKTRLEQRHTAALSEAQIHSRQSQSAEPFTETFTDTLHDILFPRPSGLLLYAELLEHAIIRGNTLQIHLRGIRGSIHLTFRTAGRKSHFTTEITSMKYFPHETLPQSSR